MSESTASPIPLQLFTLKDGLVACEGGQEVVDNYAADFQGLRHFGLKIGECLELGAPWAGTLQEDDYTLNFACFGSSTDPQAPGAGALVGERRPLHAFLTLVNSQEA